MVPKVFEPLKFYCTLCFPGREKPFIRGQLLNEIIWFQFLKQKTVHEGMEQIETTTIKPKRCLLFEKIKDPYS